MRWDPVSGKSELPFSMPLPQRAKVEAAHFMWALGDGTSPACMVAADLLDTWVGPVPVTKVPWTRIRDAEMTAVRTVGRTVQYAQAGLAPARHEGWITLGARAETVKALRDEATRLGWNFAARSAELLVYGQRLVSSSGNQMGVRSDRVLRERLVAAMGAASRRA